MNINKKINKTCGYIRDRIIDINQDLKHTTGAIRTYDFEKDIWSCQEREKLENQELYKVINLDTHIKLMRLR